jgi:hypothetical protein
MLNRKTIFRPQAQASRSNQWLGSSTLYVPNSFIWFSAAAILLSVLICNYLIWGSYTASETVSGLIEPKSGIHQTKAVTDGVVSKILVKQGQSVTLGTVLMIYRDLKQERSQREFEKMAQQRSRLSGAEHAQTDRQPRQQLETVTEIKAAVDGLVYDLGKTVGQNFSEYELLVSLAPNSELMINLSVSAKAQAKLSPGTSVAVELTAFKNNPKGRVMGIIHAVGMAPKSSFDRSTGQKTTTYKVSILLDVSNMALSRAVLLGKAVTIKLPLEKRQLYQWLLDPMKTLFS